MFSATRVEKGSRATTHPKGTPGMVSLLDKWAKLPAVFKVGVVMLFLEACYILYWLGSMIYLVIGDNSSSSHKTFHALLAIHMVTVPIALLYVIESHKRHIFRYLIWVFLAGAFLDLFALLEVTLHPDDVAHPIAHRLEFAAAVWTFSMSCILVVWFVAVLLYKANEKPEGARRQPLLTARY